MSKKSIFYNNGVGQEFILSNINPKVWGPHYWTTIFSTAAKYPIHSPTEIDKENTMSFFAAVGHGLPCSKCRTSYSELLQRFPIEDALQNRKSLLTWVYIIRDQINRKLICQERNEYKKQLQSLPDNVDERVKNKLQSQILFTQPSPPLQDVLNRWFFYHQK